MTKTILFIIGALLALSAATGCATLGQPDVEQKLIAAASKCIADASTILAAQREADATEHAAVQLLQLQREANAKSCPAPDPAQAMPLQSRKP